MASTTVLVIVSGDASTTEIRADRGRPLGELLPGWARRCSRRPADELVILSGDRTTGLDLAFTLGDLGLSDGSVVHLVGADEVTPAAWGGPAIGTPATAVASSPPSPPTVPPTVGPALRSPPPGRSQWAARPTGPKAARPIAPPGDPAAATAPLQPAATPELERPATADRAAPDGPGEASGNGATGSGATGSGATGSGATGTDAATGTSGRLGAAPHTPGRPAPTNGDLPVKVSGARRLAGAVKAALSPRSVPSPAPGAFAFPTRLTARQRYRQALTATNRSHNLEVIIRSAPLRRCMVVAVVSPKGGPGKTTVTALLGSLFAELRRDPVLALDANPDLGDLKDKLGEDGQIGVDLVDDLAAWLEDNPSAPPAQLWSRLGVGPHGLRYVATPRPPECSTGRMIAAADYDLYLGLITRLRDYAGIILVDCGTGLLDPPVRAALRAADQIVLVTDGSATTARQVVAAADLLPDGTPTWLVANKMAPRGSKVDLPQVAAAIPRLLGVTVIPCPRKGQLAESIVTPAFRWSEAPGVWQEPIREVAARLARDWPLHRL